MSSNIIPDLQERKAALDIGRSFLVQAPAGSGKTELLTQRFLKLLTHVTAPEEIIAITFTNKAAAEMRLRIVSALAKAETTPPENSHEKLTWTLAQTVLQRSQEKNWHLCEHPSRLRILTMDALSLQIARKLPISSKLGAQLDIAEDPLSLYQQAVKIILLSPPKEAPWLPDIKVLLLYLDNDYYRLESLLITLLSKRDQWLPLMMLGNNNEQKKALLEYELSHINQFVLQQGQGLLPIALENEIKALALYAANNLTVILSDTTSIKENWLFIASILLTQHDQLRKKSDKNLGFPSSASAKSQSEKILFTAYKQRYQTLVNTLQQYPRFIAWLIEIRKLPQLHYSERQWQILSSLLTLLPLCAAQLRLVFAIHNQVDYIENAQSALYALGDAEQPSDISLSLDNTIQHLLVDEFQDTSSNQFLLLQKLTTGWMPGDRRSLFLVGDPMQSIYRFRQAEVGLFLHAKHYGLGDIKLDFIILSSNFRASAQLVQWTNTIFQSIFPDKELIRLGAIPYSAATAVHGVQKDSMVRCLYFAKQDVLAEEHYLVNTIKDLRQNAPNETIAILIRSRQHLTTIIPLLQTLSIPYQAIDVEALAHKPMIHDLVSLTRACLHMADRIAWLACLRAPWCGLTLQDLWLIAQNATEKTIWELIADDHIIATLEGDAKRRLLHFRQAMTFAIQQRQRIPLRDIVEKTWQYLGGEKFLTAANQHQDLEKFFTLLEQMPDHQGIIVIEILEKKIKKLFSATIHSTLNPVQIMTIHKAKGLEFDHVFLPKLHKKIRSSDKALIAWLEYPDGDNTHHLLMAPMSEVNTSDKLYDYLQHQQKQKDLLETDRILYVAATRAKKCLFLTTTLEIDHITAPRRPQRNDSLLGRIWNSHPNLFQKDNTMTTLKSLDVTLSRSLPFYRVTLSAITQLSQLTQPNISYIAQQKNTPPLLTLSIDRNAAKLGSIFHLLLEKITQEDYTWWPSIASSQQNLIIQALCQHLNLAADKQDDAIDIIQQAINNTLQDPRGQWIIQHHPISYTEHTIYDYHHQQWQKKIIDRFFIDEKGECWIVDYKMSHKKSPTLSTTTFIKREAQKYSKQLHSYHQALSRIIKNKVIKLALYFPLLPAWYVYPDIFEP